MIQKLEDVTRDFYDEEIGEYQELIEPSNSEVFIKTDNLHDQEKVDLFLSKADKISLQDFEKLMNQIK